jgi:ParB family chromosome partitioning protein
MSATTTIEVEYIDPKLISPDPNNPRKALRDIDAMAASITLHGVLSPINVRPDPKKDGRFVIDVEGHRRHAGALQAGLDVVPCIVDGVADEKVRATRRMVSNLQRDDFTATELARGVQQLMDLGMEEADIAVGLSVAPEAVANAARVAKSEKSMTIAEKHDLSFEQALALAEFDDDKEVLIHLTTTAVQNPGQFEYIVNRYRREKKRTEAISEAEQKARDEGLTIVDEPGWNSDKPIARLDQLLDPDTEKRLTAAKHKKCPGHAVYIAIDYEDKVHVIACCTDWKANGHKNQFASGRRGDPAVATKSEAQKAIETQERREHRAGIDTSKSAQEVRRAFATAMLARATLPKGVTEFVVEQLTHEHSGMEGRHAPIYGELVGIKGDSSYSGHVVVQRKFLAKVPKTRVINVLLARVIAEREYEWEPNSWASNENKRKDYLNFLILNGYTPSTVEKVCLGKAKAADVLIERDAEKARLKATARVSAPAPAKKQPAKKVRARKVPARKRSAGVRR